MLKGWQRGGGPEMSPGRSPEGGLNRPSPRLLSILGLGVFKATETVGSIWPITPLTDVDGRRGPSLQPPREAQSPGAGSPLCQPARHSLLVLHRQVCRFQDAPL